RRGRGQLAEVVSTNDEVFGLNRSDRRQIKLAAGRNILPELLEPIRLKAHSSIFLSLLIEFLDNDPRGELALQFYNVQ
ncbi:MAG: hypothetical protein CMJ78_14410, partial [Planctomycetaceae bacterium]|nr:hypothetical protein [Planctomycetaceae bacterium]